MVLKKKPCLREAGKKQNTPLKKITYDFWSYYWVIPISFFYQFVIYQLILDIQILEVLQTLNLKNVVYIFMRYFCVFNF